MKRFSKQLAFNILVVLFLVLAEGCKEKTSGNGNGDCTPSVVVREKWTLEFSERIYKVAVGTDGTIFASSADRSLLVALHPDDGHELWQFDSAAANSYIPAIGADGTVLLPSFDRHLYALNPGDGSERWNFPAPDNIYTPAIGIDGTIYLPCSDGHMFALDPATGAERWNFLGSNLFGVPAIAADGTIYVADRDGHLYAVDPATGMERWNFPAEGELYGPAVGPNGDVYVPSNNGNLYAVSAVDGSQLWVFTAGGVVYTPAVGQDGTIFVPSADAYLYALNPADGGQIWNYFAVDRVKPPAIGPDGTVYAASDNEVIQAGSVFALDPSNGDLLWFHIGEKGFTMPSIGHDGTVYVPTWDTEPMTINTLFAFRPDPNAVSRDDLACIPCETRCSSNTEVEGCKHDGSGFVPFFSCGDNQGCVDGLCIDCVSHDHVDCHEGQPHWFDSCGNAEEQESTCSGDEVCRGGVCGPPCDLTCGVEGESFGGALSCGVDPVNCTYGYDGFGRVNSMNCTYSNGVSFSCTATYNSMGQPSGSCSGVGSTCYF